MSTTSGTETSNNSSTPTPPEKHQKWLLLLLYCSFAAVGSVGSVLLQRLYFTHGGSLKWFISGLQSVGCVILLPPLFVLYFKTKQPSRLFFVDLALFCWSVGIGILIGLSNYLFSVGLSRIPVSTASLLYSTSLAFTALFALILVRQKFTFYSTNAVVSITLGAVVLGLHSSSDRPSGITKGKYLVGFFFTLAAAALAAFCTPLYQLAYSKSKRSVNFLIMLQVVVVVSLSSALFALVGMLISKEFQAISKDAEEFSLGKGVYWLIAVVAVVIAQMSFFGTVGIIKCMSALFAGIFGSSLVPIIQVASVIVFHEKFSGVKALSLVLCLWGFTSYFLGEFKMTKKLKNIVRNTLEDVNMESKIDLECLTEIEMEEKGKANVQEV